jgi:hypothetical protein
VLSFSEDGPTKIGVSSYAWGRIKNIQTSNYKEIFIHSIYWLKNSNLAVCAEKQCHASFEDKKIRGEWFDVSPYVADLSVAQIVQSYGEAFDHSTTIRILEEKIENRAKKEKHLRKIGWLPKEKRPKESHLTQIELRALNAMYPISAWKSEAQSSSTLGGLK